MTRLEQLRINHKPLIEQTRNKKELVLTVPYDVMIDFIGILGIIGEGALYGDLIMVASGKYGDKRVIDDVAEFIKQNTPYEY